jgi:hypothetical protein
MAQISPLLVELLAQQNSELLAELRAVLEENRSLRRKLESNKIPVKETRGTRASTTRH